MDTNVHQLLVIANDRLEAILEDRYNIRIRRDPSIFFDAKQMCLLELAELETGIAVEDVAEKSLEKALLKCLGNAKRELRKYPTCGDCSERSAEKCWPPAAGKGPSRRLRSSHLQRAKANLPMLTPKQMQVIELRFGSGNRALTFDQIAQRLHCTRQRAHELLTRALTNLRKGARG
jgi:DNA-directed RNA polymerase specialized sigma24 family protein